MSGILKHIHHLRQIERYQKFSVDVVDEIVKKYPKIKKIPPETSHLKLIKEGINVVLTVLVRLQLSTP